MRFTDLLRTTVLLSAAAATALALVTLGAATSEQDENIVWVSAGWWILASLIGAWLGRHEDASPAIGRLLADSKAATMMPEQRPGAIVVNRLWPLIFSTVAAGGMAVLAPQVPAVAAGFTLIWALSWRRQHLAVRAIEERDGVTFHVDPTSPLRAIRLVRTPGFRRERRIS
ncbi:hypothetical protein [Paraconexibacter algicola]|uniref:Uncharacterized protein n=1 Tax=Paraconexibacter algicola TaxID=2133960 RepID=A0A2T4UJH2_9ACTN|nr:hypothetical protein [Paraconexibacter algicola]PTL59382.1 hypothetical protein C7Y72_06800 [Paraconexibacter algicola]